MNQLKKLAGIIVVFAILLFSQPVAASAQVIVDFLDVGQGDSTLVRAGETTVLIDTGRNRSTLDQLEDRGVVDLDLLILTHAHADHITNADTIVKEMSPAEVWMSSTPANSQVYERLLDALIETDTHVEYPTTGDSYEVGSLDFSIVHPLSLIGDLNNDSLSFQMVAANTSFLFTGDAEERAENMMLGTRLQLQSDIYHMGHHGSRTSSSAPFMSAVRPEVAIYSAGINNSYGHPHKEAIDRVRAVGATIYGTAENGTVTVNVTNSGYTIQTER
ncbi:ComEC/Rec2 family competence protein [Shouchella clausii]|uniref:ComEC/Rec2 family competence protein n=1 Tax=Shouchella TaxID=2893057 RepID=UPI0004E66E4A|nr:MULTISPECIES: ComEC/Rec2 family competence protein [Shouchella]ALA55083.1 Late competence protein ComEC, DNA transport [Shouchella clausii]MBU3231059.1 MBL fold metallo-hydrolase [Shouchella clausii]MBU3262866.1 MBL fold metallo-hydrolase [Shouchella clausii]MBU3505330.1 MBL fold metallo-hydrolase [Shouchella clausii]MBU3534896.1 MBL fold metallo-hydrolase [Shouchella clausii]